MNNKTINTVTVIGANGTLGYQVSALFASFGSAKVYMVSRSIKSSIEAIEKAIKSVRSESIRKYLIPCDYSCLEKYVPVSDLIFESVIEDINVKKNVFALVGKYAKPGSIITSGTSGLSIEQMCDVLPKHLQETFFGFHFFNPPYSMPLFELVVTHHNTQNLIDSIVEYMNNKLNRKTVVVKDSPAFLANRIGFCLINYALILANTYSQNGGIDYIDYVLGGYTGRIMPPCLTADYIGLGVCGAIVDNVKNNVRDDYVEKYYSFPSFAKSLVEQNGINKCKSPLYDRAIENGVTKEIVFDIESGKYRKRKKYNIDFVEKAKESIREGDYYKAFELINSETSEEGKICREFLQVYVNYSLFVSKELDISMSDVDNAMANGFNWCPPSILHDLLFGGTDKIKTNYYPFFRAN